MGSEHRGRGGHSKRPRKKHTKYSLESSGNDQQYYVKKYGQNGSGRNGYHMSDTGVNQDNDYIEPSLALQTVNTVDIDCVSDNEVDSLPDDDNPMTLDSFV